MNLNRKPSSRSTNCSAVNLRKNPRLIKSMDKDALTARIKHMLGELSSMANCVNEAQKESVGLVCQQHCDMFTVGCRAESIEGIAENGLVALDEMRVKALKPCMSEANLLVWKFDGELEEVRTSENSKLIDRMKEMLEEIDERDMGV